MCTLSFLPKPNGYTVAMNRDEKRTRVAGLPPAIVQLADRRAVFPREPAGGTWIAVNDAGICLALINWHRIQTEPAEKAVSRGDVITSLMHVSSSDEIADAIGQLPLPRLRPFRLITIAPRQKDVTEWQWNLTKLHRRPHAWAPWHWFSSGFDEPRAESERQRVCDSIRPGESLNIATLRRLHQSHAPERGPFSICMHRSDAKTVSYTEVIVDQESAIMRYQPNSPCSGASFEEIELDIREFLGVRE